MQFPAYQLSVFQRRLVLVHKLMCGNKQFITSRFLKRSSLGPLLCVRPYHLISIAPTRLGPAPLLVISAPRYYRAPPPLAPSGRLYVLTAVLLCSFGFTRTHTQAHTHPSRPSESPLGCGGHQRGCGRLPGVCVSLFAVCHYACCHPAAVCILIPLSIYALDGAVSGAAVTSQHLHL